MVDVAERVGSVFKSKWSLFQQPSTKHAVQERFLSAAASTSFLLRKGFSETKDKVVVGKTRVEEVMLYCCVSLLFGLCISSIFYTTWLLFIYFLKTKVHHMQTRTLLS